MFYNEYDVLKGRLEYLYDYVDYFVIVESNITYAGNPKPLNFLQNKSRYKKYLDKVIYSPKYFNISDFNFDKKITSLDLSHASWQVEHQQRDHITDTLRFFDDDAIVIVGDCDEIPDRKFIPHFKNDLDNDSYKLRVLKQNVFYYNFRKLQTNDWYGPVVTVNSVAKHAGAQWLRDYRSGFTEIHNAGWHISYWGDEYYIQNKIKNAAHREYDYDEYTDLDRIRTVIELGSDLYNRTSDTCDFDESSLPRDFYNIFDKISYKPKLQMKDIETLPSAWKGHRAFAEWLVSTINPNVIVDLGVDYGYSTFCLANPKNGVVYGIDTFTGDAHAGHHSDALAVVTEVVQTNDYQNVKIIQGYFDEVAMTWQESIDILHIDGLHTYEAAKNDFVTWSKFLNENAVVLMHDVVAFQEVRQVFDEIDMPKMMFTHSAGLGVLSKNSTLIEEIKNTFANLL